eukprot:CAMPEP_0169419656 /NCGR_PEP_ID=MMETSP1017-20121227/65125_1 /TAXON_ID=342587 /ORGANISM="Karlodinium micrum, Strain CCMP2283" /LENGTH=151 /DNA_ID=CAMNT_0009528391 /DNA_START=332 /DNA_END=787 /DNA_ORIENTATION=+
MVANTTTIAARGMLERQFAMGLHKPMNIQIATIAVVATKAPSISCTISNDFPTNIGTNSVRSSTEPKNAMMKSVCCRPLSLLPPRSDELVEWVINSLDSSTELERVLGLLSFDSLATKTADSSSQTTCVAVSLLSAPRSSSMHSSNTRKLA